MPSNVIAVLTEALHGDGPVEEIARCAGGEVRLVVPAVEESPPRRNLAIVPFA